MKRIWCACHLSIVMFASTSGLAEDQLPREARIPGGIALITLPAEKTQAFYLGKPLLRLHNQQRHYAVVGIPLDTPAGELSVDLISGNHSEAVSFSVSAHDFPEQRITLKDNNMVSPDAASQARIANDLAQIITAYQQHSTPRQPLHLFQWPASGIISSNFGLKRFFNGEPRQPHSGIDVAANEGQRLYSPGYGKVIKTANFFFNGNTVMIDHGEGLISLLCHLSAISVQEGDSVAAGDLIGKVGHTGRATGSHMHWSLSLNDARIDPRLLVQPELTHCEQESGICKAVMPTDPAPQ